MMMPCPELPMSIDNAVWHLSSDEAAGFVTSSSFNSSLSASRLAGDDASTADMISKFIAENITAGNEVQVQQNTESGDQPTTERKCGRFGTNLFFCEKF